jgi:lysophospholipid acyltransferase (LPLAT)-like uncharacterized protein
VLLTKLAARLIVGSLRIIFATCRKQYAPFPGTNAYDAAIRNRFLYSVWHDLLVFPLFVDKPHHMSALVSKHQDGSYLSESMHLLNVEPYRGSTNRGGAQAVRQLLDVVDRKHITITPDGPRGPRHVLKDGIVFLASRTGQAIVPMACGCRRGFRIKGSWTDMLIPLPFTTVYGSLGRPIHVPPDLSRQQLAEYTARVQQGMEQLQAQLDDWIAGRNDGIEFNQTESQQAAA